MNPRLSLCNLPTECLEMIFALVSQRNLYWLQRTCRLFQRLIHLHPMAAELFQLALPRVSEKYAEYRGPLYRPVAKLLLSQDWPDEDLADYVELLDDHMVREACGDHDKDTFYQAQLTQAILEACRPLLGTPAGSARVFNLCRAMSSHENHSVRGRVEPLHRELLIRQSDAETMTRQSLLLTQVIVVTHPVKCNAYLLSITILERTLKRLERSHPLDEQAAELLSDEIDFCHTCSEILRYAERRFYPEAVLRQNLETMTELYEGMKCRTDVLQRISQHVRCTYQLSHDMRDGKD